MKFNVPLRGKRREYKREGDAVNNGGGGGEPPMELEPKTGGAKLPSANRWKVPIAM